MLSPAEVFSWAAKTAAVPKYIGQINRNAKECNKFAFKHERQLLGGLRRIVADLRTQEMCSVAAHLAISSARRYWLKGTFPSGSNLVVT